MSNYSATKPDTKESKGIPARPEATTVSEGKSINVFCLKTENLRIHSN